MSLKQITILRFSVSIFLTVIIFLIDIIIPYEYLEWLLYVIPILILYRIDNPTYILIELGLIAVLLFAGIIIEPDIDIPLIRNITHRVEGFLTFVIFSFLVFRLNKTLNELKTANIHLEKRSRELADSVRELESFSYSVSHDLRSPLGTISGFIDLLKEDYSGCLDQSGLDYLNVIKVTSSKMIRLINDLLRLSRVSKHAIESKRISLSSLAESIIDDLQKLNRRENMKIIINPDMIINADPNLFGIAISNLINNAWKYTAKKNEPFIEIGKFRKNSQIIFFIKDNGAGFDLSKSRDLFEPFRRYHSDQEFPGTGIGLSIVRRIIERHGGRIWAEAEPGKGATFFFTLDQ
ncbi:MAG: GHKL domain-containing protein [Fibrobacter sp.]|nr:GHKL domain-containing protein [Fibrobacter sp.]